MAVTTQVEQNMAYDLRNYIEQFSLLFFFMLNKCILILHKLNLQGWVKFPIGGKPREHFAGTGEIPVATV